MAKRSAQNRSLIQITNVDEKNVIQANNKILDEFSNFNHFFHALF